jgi:hypothetical protein
MSRLYQWVGAFKGIKRMIIDIYNYKYITEFQLSLALIINHVGKLCLIRTNQPKVLELFFT